MGEVSSKLHLPDTAQIVVVDAEGQQVPYQITSDEKVISGHCASEWLSRLYDKSGYSSRVPGEGLWKILSRTGG